MLTTSKNSLNLLKSTFIQCFHHFEPNWVQVSLKLFTPKDVLTLMHNSSCFWKLSDSERVNESQKLLKYAKKYYYPNFSSLWTKLSKNSYFYWDMRFYDCLIRRWLPTRSIHVLIERIYRYQLKSNYLKNRQFFTAFFFAFLESTISLQWSEKKMILIGFIFLKFLTARYVLV